MTAIYPLPRETRQTTILSGDGVSSTYGPFGFKLFDVVDVEVWTKPDGDSYFALNETVTVTKTAAAALDTFSVTFAAALPATTDFIVIGKRTHERSSDVTIDGIIRAALLEKELSKQGAVIQELRRDMDRALSADFDVPALKRLPAPEAGKGLFGNAAGDGYENKELAALGALATDVFGRLMLQTADQAAALTLLGVDTLGDKAAYDPDITGVAAPYISIWDKLRQNLTASDIKALGDDSTDNATAINNALSDLGGWGGGVLTLNMDRDNGGHYRVASRLDVPSNVVLRGENRNVILDIDHNDAIGVDFAGISGTRNTYNGLFDITLQASASRDNTYELVRFQQIQDSAMVRVKFEGTPYSFNLFESLNIALVDVEWDDCEYVDFTVGNAVDTFVSRLYHIGNTSPSGLSKNALGQAFLSQNGTSGFYANHWLAVRKYRGFEWGKRSGATGKTSEHFTVLNAIADNCKDAGYYITDLFNASFSACAAMYCGNIDQADGDPNSEERNGVYMSSTEHPTVASQPSTQNVHFDSACRIWASSRAGLHVKRSAGGYDPQFWSYAGQIGTSNLIEDAAGAHVYIDSGFASDFSLDGLRCEPMEIKAGGGSYAAKADHCVRFNGALSNQRVRLTNMLLGDISGSSYVSGDISGNTGVIVHGNSHLFWTSWPPTLSFGGGSTGITYTTQTGRVRKANGMVYLEGEILLSSKGTDTGAAVIGGLPVTPLGNAVGQIEFRSGGAAIPTNGLSVRSTTSGTLAINYQGATGSDALDDTKFTDTARLHFSIIYAAANP